MRHEILDAPNFALLKLRFDGAGEQAVAESGALVAKSAAVTVQTSLRGGLIAAAKRSVLGGESLFQNTYTAGAAGDELWLAPAAEGDLKGRVLSAGESFFLQSGAYLAHHGPELVVDTRWGGVRGFFGGLGLFLLRISGPGTVFYGSYGALHEVEVGPGGYTADTGHVVAFTEGLEYRVRPFGGAKGLFFSGEGLVCDFSGRGSVFLQTRSPASLASFLHPYRPVKARGSSE
ncbi:MAG: TIGR00266 family protein [Deltaproteobacteria bacterium]|nr:TIGR00266 family protein [Deltaproteobacteria bacterium]